jgi:cell division septation protein DedD
LRPGQGGRGHLAAGRDDDASRAFSASLERSADGPYAPAAHLALIRLAIHSGQFDELPERLGLLAALGSSPELEIALDLLDPGGGGGPVRPFPSPVGLFEAARLADGLVPSSLPELPPVRPAVDALPADAPSEGESRARQEQPPEGLVAVAEPTTRPGPRFTLRIGSFRDPINVRHMVNALRDAEFPVRTRENGELVQVLVGAVATRPAAELLLKRVQAIGYDGDIIPYRGDSGTGAAP